MKWASFGKRPAIQSIQAYLRSPGRSSCSPGTLCLWLPLREVLSSIMTDKTDKATPLCSVSLNRLAKLCTVSSDLLMPFRPAAAAKAGAWLQEAKSTRGRIMLLEVLVHKVVKASKCSVLALKVAVMIRTLGKAAI